MNPQAAINDQVERFHLEMVELVKKYQFRDRNEITCCGVSVSQCYALEALVHSGRMTVNKLAHRLQLSISTVTRVVEQLVKKQLVRRGKDLKDRRFHVIELTAKGKSAYRDSWANVFKSEKTILRNVPARHRAMLIDLLKNLNTAIDQWRSCCTLKPRKGSGNGSKRCRA